MIDSNIYKLFSTHNIIIYYMPKKKIVALKAPKKPKVPRIKVKDRQSIVAHLDDFWTGAANVRLQKLIENKAIKDDPYYTGSENESGSDSDSDADKFKPTVIARKKKIRDDVVKEPIISGLNIVALPTTKNQYPMSKLMKEGHIPLPVGCHIVIGAIASGKTVMICNMLLNINIWGNVFDNIFLLTNSDDDQWDYLINKGILKKQNIKHNPEPSDIAKIIKLQKTKIKEANGDASLFPSTLIISDDIIDNQQLMKSKEMKLLFIRPRQLNIAHLCSSQYLNSIDKTCRMQALSCMLFNGNKMEEELYEELFTPAGMTKKDFQLIMKTAWHKDETSSHPYLFINRKNPIETRFHRNFSTVIRI
jgi:hypothetical protein